jgi:hypothetical protein
VAEFALFTNRVDDSVQLIVSTQFANSALLFAKRTTNTLPNTKSPLALYDDDEACAFARKLWSIELTSYAETNSPEPRMGANIIIEAPAGEI